MHRITHYFSSILLTATLGAPLYASPIGLTQDKHEKQEEKREEKARERYYDKHHKDYHDWDDREEHSFHLYLTEKHHPIIEFRRMKERDRQRYWTWRHSHEDHDNR